MWNSYKYGNLLFIVLFCGLLCSCADLRKGSLDVHVSSGTRVLPGASVTIFALKKSTWIPLGDYKTDANGQVVLPVDFYAFQSVKVVVTSDVLDPVFLPKVQIFQIPAFWQEQILKAFVSLQTLSVAHPVSSMLDVTSKTSLFHPVSSLSYPDFGLAWIQKMESNIEDDPTWAVPQTMSGWSAVARPVTAVEHARLPVVTAIVSQPTLSFVVPCVVQALFDKTPQSNVNVYFGYQNSQVLQWVCQTDEHGTCSSNINVTNFPDSVFYQKDGFKSQSQPFIKHSFQTDMSVCEKNPQILTLVSGHSKAFVLASQAYGFDRGVDKSTLFVHGVKQDTASFLGLLIQHKPLEDKTFPQVSFVPYDGLLSSIAQDDIIASDDGPKTPGLTVVSVPVSHAYKPTVGLFEPDSEVAQSPVWRLARREFFSKFINEKSIKSKIHTDLIQMTNLPIHLLIDTLSQGWQKNLFAKDLDFVIRFFGSSVQNFDQILLTCQLYHKQKGMILEQQQIVTLDNAQEKAFQIYSFVLSHLPLQAYGQWKDHNLVMNLGTKHWVHVGDTFHVYQSVVPFGRPTHEVGVAIVKSITADQCELSLNSGVEKKLHSQKINFVFLERVVGK